MAGTERRGIARMRCNVVLDGGTRGACHSRRSSPSVRGPSVPGLDYSWFRAVPKSMMQRVLRFVTELTQCVVNDVPCISEPGFVQIALVAVAASRCFLILLFS